MVRAAFEGDGASFPSTATSFRVCTAWLTAPTTVQMEVAINRPTKLRFPQGSEVWSTGCPKFGTAEKSGLTNPGLEAETVLPRLRRWRADDRSDRTVQYRKDLHDRPHRQSGDRLHQSLGLHVHLGGADLAADDW